LDRFYAENSKISKANNRGGRFAETAKTSKISKWGRSMEKKSAARAGARAALTLARGHGGRLIRPFAALISRST
jgi:hypothetical protein